MNYDLEYVNLENPYHLVKWTYCGQYAEIGGECSQAQLEQMNDLQDVDGFVCVDPEATNLTPDVETLVNRIVSDGTPRKLAVKLAILEYAQKHRTSDYSAFYASKH